MIGDLKKIEGLKEYQSNNQTYTGIYHTYSINRISMVSWLTNESIANFDKKFAEVIEEKNATMYEVEYGIYEADTDWSSAETFEEYLYLDYKFITGDLYATPRHGSPLLDDHKKDCGGHLAELVKYGMFTHHGQEPRISTENMYYGSLRSFLDFVVLIHDDNIPDFISFLKELHAAGVNVGAQEAKGDTLIKEYVFATSEDGLTLMDEDFKVKNNPGVEKRWCEKKFGTFNGRIFDWGIDDAGFEEQVMNYKKDTHTRFHCEVWSRFFDGSKVEDTLMPMWKAFNAKFGKKNQS